MPALVLLLMACKDEGEQQLPYFQPVAVGFRFDGMLRSDGTLAAASYKGEAVPPTLALEFVSDSYFVATSGAELAANSCLALASFEEAPGAPLPTHDGSTLFVSYEASLSIAEHSCASRVDPAVWGEDAIDLVTPFQGAHVGYGLGPMTEDLKEDWSATALQEIGPAMVASWVALNALDGSWVASDWTTSFLFEIDEATSEILVTTDEETGEEILVPLTVDGLAPPDALPAAYVQSVPNWYQDFPLIDFDNLD